MAYRKLGRTSSQRKAMLRDLTTDLLINESIVTTEARAKEIRKTVEKMITLGKRGDLHARRQAADGRLPRHALRLSAARDGRQSNARRHARPGQRQGQDSRPDDRQRARLALRLHHVPVSALLRHLDGHGHACAGRRLRHRRHAAAARPALPARDNRRHSGLHPLQGLRRACAELRPLAVRSQARNGGAAAAYHRLWRNQEEGEAPCLRCAISSRSIRAARSTRPACSMDSR